jgi:hypothetical protein
MAAGIVLFTRYQAMNNCHENSAILKSMTVSMDPGQEAQFIEQARQFAFKHDFRLDAGFSELPNSSVRMRMIRSDVAIIVRNPLNPGAFEIGFYNYDCIHPTLTSDIDDLVIDFKRFLSEVPTAWIAER